MWKNQYLGEIHQVMFGQELTSSNSKKIGFFASKDSLSAINLRNHTIGLLLFFSFLIEISDSKFKFEKQKSLEKILQRAKC